MCCGSLGKNESFCNHHSKNCNTTNSTADNTSLNGGNVSGVLFSTEIKTKWRAAVGFEGLYEVSNKGKVRSLNYRRLGRRKIMKQAIDGSGYAFVSLRKDGKYHLKKIHRLVYEAFVGKLPEYTRKECGTDIFTIDHIDGNKLNNHVENLELVTHTENTHRYINSERNKEGSIQIKAVYQYSKDLTLIRIWPSTRECHRNGFDWGCVAACCRHNINTVKFRTYRNYIWTYKPLSNL